ncbi:MAG: aspartate kinase [Oscillospiraceae bacterium]
MSLVVQKFGGSSVRDAERLQNVANIVTGEYEKGNDVIVVVSAQGDTTDDLIDKAKEINPDASLRDMDFLLSTGEQISAALLCMTIKKMGFQAVPLTGWQAGFLTTSSYGKARIRRIHTERLEQELDKKNIVVVTGFQGLNRFDEITTLGRGGSDTSAVAIAAALHADKCQIFTDVDGVYTADPRLVPTAKKLQNISYDEMLELATLGAQVLHNRSVEMAKKYNITLEVLSSLENKPGTIVKEVSKVEKMLIKGVAKDDNIARISIIGLPDQPGIAFKVFSLMANLKVNVDIILQSVGRDGTKDITFTVARDEVDAVVKALEEERERLRIKEIDWSTDVSKVSIVGAGMESNPGVAAKMFEALADAHINIHMISTSEIKISVLIDKEFSKKAVVAVHDAFDINDK